MKHWAFTLKLAQQLFTVNRRVYSFLSSLMFTNMHTSMNTVFPFLKQQTICVLLCLVFFSEDRKENGVIAECRQVSDIQYITVADFKVKDTDSHFAQHPLI